MERITTKLPDVFLLKPKKFEDERGYFLETYHKQKLASFGINDTFVQDNYSRSYEGVLRGLHYQIGNSQAKLARVTRGKVLDVVVDIRFQSPTFGQWVKAELSEENHLVLYAPKGYAHGFLVLSDIADFHYKCSDFYSPHQERGVLWNDKRIGIDWPFEEISPIVNDRDLAFPLLEAIKREDLPSFNPPEKG